MTRKFRQSYLRLLKDNELEYVKRVVQLEYVAPDLWLAEVMTVGTEPKYL